MNKIADLRLWLRVGTYLFFLVLSHPTSAQIVPDRTLPNNSIVTPTNDTSPGITTPGQGTPVIHLINGGTQAGKNLFHSFQEFSLPTGHTANFNNSVDIQNIITRVTGNSISIIDGLIKANGSANLFILNPNGIIFGPNAQLNIGGAFIASTAQAINFADGTQFNANSTGSTPLLTVSVPLGLQINSPTISSPGITIQGSNLQVNSGQTISLVANQINFIGGNLKAEKGRIELASITNGSWSLFSNIQPLINQLGDIQLSQTATVDTSGVGGGNILIQTRSLRLTDGSQIRANTLGAEPGGNLTVNASESVEVIGRLADGTPSALQARVESNANGNGGNININTRNLRVEGGARVAASSLTDTPANAGNISVQATDKVEIIGVKDVTQNEQNIIYPSALSTQTTGAGNAGKINIETGNLVTREGGQISSETFGSGNAGNIDIQANQIQIDGRSFDGTAPSGILARTKQEATGNAGNIIINTDTLTVTNGARIAAASLGVGKAGNLTILAQDSVEVTGVGNNIDGSVNPTQISVLTTGSGEAGTLDIETRKLTAENGGQISASTQGISNGGNLTVKAEEVQLIGRSPDGGFPSGLLARVEPKASGNAGNVVIETQRLTLTNGARVAASSLGEGKAGSVTIRAAQKVEVNGVGKNVDGSSNPTQISVLTTGTGTAGFLNIQSGELTVGNGGQVTASTTGSGNGGSLTVKAENVQLNGRSPDGIFPSSLLARVEGNATGNGGDLIVETGRLTVRDGARVAAASLTQAPLNNPLEQGKAGNVTIRANNVEVAGVGKNADGTANPAQISVLSTGVGTPGNLSIDSPSILLNNQGSISAASQKGTGGNITFNSQNVVLRRQSVISADAGAGGSEGNIKINTQIMVLLGGSKIITDAESPTGGSNINISAPSGSDLLLLVSPDSIINARGELIIEGEVEVKAPELPKVEVVDATNLVAQTCPEGEEVSTFYVTGRGGIPTNPNEPLSGDLFWEDLRIPQVSKDAGVQGRKAPGESYQSPTIVEAQGWVIGSKGEVILTAETANFTLHDAPFNLPACRSR
ncbi:filamentous hemagglutinin N-terminal domain-containing protein [Aerosakkonemataceae cyanobacterium BLCC-F50]|uniref:Filamentous hemagglutinin N-terminal domain-containing protein n=1 Tax=Floridaenema flaviceps BLCC-F50 TaxID=3153642 RepID=A0ABV4Y3N6_9CYAN